MVTISYRSWLWQLRLFSWLAIGWAIAVFGDCTLAQIVPDGTLGAERSVVTTNTGNVDVISGGATRGANLFHSFEQFSVRTGGEAFFNNTASIQNIISRVTGGSISNIDGLLRANGTANLFLLNPSGIIFGSNASLNIGGSFVGSTASSLNFADGTSFGAAEPQNTPLLTVSVPIGLQFGGTAGSIRNQSHGLQVKPGKTLALAGGDVALEGVTLTAQGGRIELGSVSSPSLVSLAPTEQGWVLGYEGVQNFQDIQLSPFSQVSAGDIQVRGRQVKLDDSGISSTNNLTVTASEIVEVSGTDSGLSISDLNSNSDAGDAGNLTITTEKLIIRDGAQVLTFTDKGAGNLTVTASDSVEISGVGSGLSTTNSDTKAAGDLTITTGRLIVQDGALVETNTFALGDAGDLTIRASDSVEVSGRGGIFAQTRFESIGAGGNLTIETPRLEGTHVGVRSFGQGPAGQLSVITSKPLPNVVTQIVPDTTLPVNSTVRSEFNTSIINNNGVKVGTQLGSNSIIEGGTQVGRNLFHSFKLFSIPTGSAAYLNNAPDIQNIINRVTGTSISNIDGLIQANGTASLFLLNPNGIIFGPNASLNIGGSILASTASAINFADGTQFSATAPQTLPLLTTNVPLGLQFGETAGDIHVQGSELRVPLGGTVALVGGNLNIEGQAILKSDVDDDFLAPSASFAVSSQSGQIELGSVADRSLVSLSPKNQGWSLGYEGVQNFLDIQLLSQNWLANPPDIQVAGRRVTLSDTYLNARNLSIKAEHLSAQSIAIQGLNVSMTASDLVELDETSLSASGGGTNDQDTGNIAINTRRLVVRDRSVIQSYGATSEIMLSDAAANLSGVGELRGGNLTVTASEAVELIDSSLSSNGNLGYGVTYNDPNNPEDGSATSSIRSTYLIIGSPGNVTINTGKLIVRNGAKVSVSSVGVFPGGNLAINASEFVRVSGTSPDGSIPSSLSAEFLPGSGIEEFSFLFDSNVEPEFSANRGGNIVINTPQLSIEDGAEVRASSTGTGNAGDIEITARSVFLNNQGRLIAETASGQGGNIKLRSEDLVLRRGSNISTNATGTAEGGNITIDTSVLAALENSDISANAQNARGGRVTINASGIFGTELRERLTEESDITATSNLGPEFSGIVEINNLDVDPEQGLVELPAEVVDASNQIASGNCPVSGENKFIIAGRGGLPPNPREPLIGEAVLTNWATLSGAENREQRAGNRETNSTSSTPTTIVEATGWVTNDKGEVVLTATAPTDPLDIPWLPSAGCHASKPSS